MSKILGVKFMLRPEKDSLGVDYVDESHYWALNQRSLEFHIGSEIMRAGNYPCLCDT
jgi:hypothetical protein